MNTLYNTTKKDSYWPYLYGYFGFLLLYYAPLYLQESGIELDQRAINLLEQALSVNSVLIDLARNALAHLLITGVFYFALSYVAATLNKAIHIRQSFLILIAIFWSWLLLCCINSVLFPNSIYVPAPAIPSSLVFGISILILLIFVILELRQVKLSKLILQTVTVIGIAFYANSTPTVASQGTTQRNVILIGIDSFSPRALTITKHLLPNIKQLSEASIQFKQAYTPIARTCPAWTSILSGDSPAQHGAYFNLRDIAQVDKKDLLTKSLKAQGYHTVFAMDERRFCNIDESFGFDQVIGPKAGVMDFLIQRYNDTPLTNLALQFKLSSPFFAYSYMNSASSANYNQDAFVEKISSTFSNAKPLFLAVHFESAHFPYQTPRMQPKLEHPNHFLVQQSAALQLIDYQIGNLLKQLQLGGILNNAIVILLSDHGESLGENEIIHYKKETTPIFVYGHGNNILSDWQSRSVLAVAQFQNGTIHSKPSSIDESISLLKVKNIVEEYVANGKIIDPVNNEQCFPVETGLRLFTAENYETIDPRKVAAEGLPYYSIDNRGRMVIRENKLKQLIETKDLGVWCGDKLTEFDRRENKIHTFQRQDDNSLIETDIDSKGRSKLQNYINQYQKITASLQKQYPSY